MRNILRVALLLIVVGSSWAQPIASSPYSSQGLGETGNSESAYYTALGGAATGLNDSTQTNFFNPATYSSLAKGQPLFSIGSNSRFSTFSDGISSAKTSFTSVSHISLAVPFGNRFGLAGGVKPFSKMGYDINSFGLIDEDTISYDYEGSGGINTLFVGGSAILFKKFGHKLSVGANADYFFGRTQQSRVFYADNGSGGESREYTRLRDFGVTAGLNYVYQISNENRLSFGATIRPENSVKMFKGDETFYFTDRLNIASYDTLNSSLNNEGTIVLPSKISLGLSYEYTPKIDTAANKFRRNSFLFSFDYSSTNWENYSENLNGTSTGGFFNTVDYRFGFQFTPHKEYLARSNRIKYYDRIRYRLGVRYGTQPIKSFNEQINDFGISFGLGLPIVTQRSSSSVNFGVTYGQRGNEAQGTINEDYVGFNVGISLSPGFYDRWFRKSKYD